MITGYDQVFVASGPAASAVRAVLDEQDWDDVGYALIFGRHRTASMRAAVR